MARRDFSVKDLEKVLETDGQVKSVEVDRLTPPGENHSSLVLKADFKVEINGHIRTISTVAKRVPMSPEDFILQRSLKSQKNEIIFYQEIVPLLLNFAKEYGLHKEANFYPKFCGARYSLDKSKTDPDSETVLLLENLIIEGYDVVDRYIGFDLKQAKPILKALAAFHAIPIAMKLKKPETFKILADYIESAKEKHTGPPPKGHGPPQKGHGPPGGKRQSPMWIAVQEIPEFSPYLSRLEPVVNRPMMGGPQNKFKEPWVTITHNDFWGNNILIKPNQNKEVSVVILDHARPTYDSFAKDLLFFLLTSVQNHVTEEHLDDLLKVYYDEFTRILACCQVSSVLSFDEYMEEINTIASHSEVGHAFGFSAIIFGPKNSTLDHLVGEGNLFDHFDTLFKNINQYHKDKLILIASIASRRNWI